MKQGQYIKEDKLLRRSIDILMEELGPVETSRFLSILPQKRLESVKRHHKWQERLDKERFFKDIFGV